MSITKKIFTYHLFWIFLVLSILFLFIPPTWVGSGSWDLNRTGDSGWSFGNWIWWQLLDIEHVFLLGYGIISFTKRKTNFLFSIFHVVFFILANVLNMFVEDYSVLFMPIFYVCSWVLFLLNLVLSEHREIGSH